MKTSPDALSSPVPSSRLGRLARLGQMATGVAGNMLLAGARQLAQGKRPNLSDLLPPELAAILGRLRSDAQPMPQRQVQAVLSAAWGAGWQQRFEPFSFNPMAAASIGQVHRARTLDMAPLLSEAKRQLREEADYQAEGAHLQRFAALLADAPEFVVPDFHADLSTKNVLAMSFVGGVPVESMLSAPQAERDRIVSLLVGLLFRELFEFDLMQTDPNFANYRYDPQTRQLILLDFGATRSFAPGFGQGYRALMTAAMAGDHVAMRRALMAIGYFSEQTQPKHQDAVLSLCELALTPLRQRGDFDFANSDLVPRLRAAGMALGLERDFWHIPPIARCFCTASLAACTCWRRA